MLPPEAFLDSAQDALAAVILFDQFPRNMFRGDAQAFATDPLALAIAKGALDKGYDAELGKDEKTFLLMPLEHSEDIDDQERSLLRIHRARRSRSAALRPAPPRHRRALRPLPAPQRDARAAAARRRDRRRPGGALVMALVEIALFHDRIAAEIARGALVAQGIDAILFDAGMAGLGLGMMAPVRLMVEAADEDAADALLSRDGAE